LWPLPPSGLSRWSKPCNPPNPLGAAFIQEFCCPGAGTACFTGSMRQDQICFCALSRGMRGTVRTHVVATLASAHRSAGLVRPSPSPVVNLPEKDPFGTVMWVIASPRPAGGPGAVGLGRGVEGLERRNPVDTCHKACAACTKRVGGSATQASM